MGWGHGKGKSKRLNSPSKDKTRPRPLAIESLEPRQLLSAAQTLVNPAWIITNDIGPVGLSAGDTVSDGATHTGATYLVDAFSTVQEGIDNVDVGGEVLLLPGNYSGTISINKAVKITALSGANTTNLSIDLNSGADCAGSTGVAAATVRVHLGAHVSDGVLLAGAGATVTVDSGTYSDNVTLTRSIKLLSNGGPATVNSFTLASTGSLVTGTTGVTSTSVSVNGGAKIQDAITLASTTQLTTITVAATTSSETVTINKPITFSGACTVTKFILSAGASIPSPSSVTSVTITMNAGVKLQDALNLSSTTAQTAIALPTGANTFNETATISKNVKLTATAATTIAAVILASGESVTLSGNITSTNITVNSGGKVADAVKLASSSAMSTLTVDPGTYAESITLGKSVRFNSSGTASIGSFTLVSGTAIDALSSGVTSTSITVAATVSLQDALRLASRTAQTTLFLQGSNYAETITLSTPVRFSGTVATIDAVILNSGAAIAAGSIASSLNITVNAGARVSDALALAITTAGFESLITVAAGDYADDATINTSIQFAGGPATLHSITLAGGAVIDALSTGVTSSSIIVSGGKVNGDALRLASVGMAADLLVPLTARGRPSFAPEWGMAAPGAFGLALSEATTAFALVDEPFG